MTLTRPSSIILDSNRFLNTVSSNIHFLSSLYVPLIEIGFCSFVLSFICLFCFCLFVYNYIVQFNWLSMGTQKRRRTG